LPRTERICIIGDPQDLSAVYVGWLARQRGLEVLELGEASLGFDWAFVYEDTRPNLGYVSVESQDYSLAELGGAFIRLHPQPALPTELEASAAERALLVAERRAALESLIEQLPGAVANRPSAGRSNGSKPFQMRMLARAGFTVPQWIASNDAAAIRQFAAACSQGCIYKACSGLRSHVRVLDGELLDRLAQGTSPVVLQAYIPGRDVRVHTVGGRAFATEISSAAVDYRFASTGNEFRALEPPINIVDRCCAVAKHEGLLIAGFDFRVAPDGQWYCLEVNPVPTFLPYEMSTGQTIGRALVDALISGQELSSSP
jgi:glutathione synthase/RimK-type ligase-like ATP-grasp enzyme